MSYEKIGVLKVKDTANVHNWRLAIGLSFPSLTCLVVSVEIKYHVYLLLQSFGFLCHWSLCKQTKFVDVLLVLIRPSANKVGLYADSDTVSYTVTVGLYADSDTVTYIVTLGLHADSDTVTYTVTVSLYADSDTVTYTVTVGL